MSGIGKIVVKDGEYKLLTSPNQDFILLDNQRYPGDFIIEGLESDDMIDGVSYEMSLRELFHPDIGEVDKKLKFKIRIECEVSGA